MRSRMPPAGGLGLGLQDLSLCLGFGPTDPSGCFASGQRSRESPVEAFVSGDAPSIDGVSVGAVSEPLHCGSARSLRGDFSNANIR